MLHVVEFEMVCQSGSCQETESNLGVSRDLNEGEMYTGASRIKVSNFISLRRTVEGTWTRVTGEAVSTPRPGAAVRGSSVTVVLGEQEPQKKGYRMEASPIVT